MIKNQFDQAQEKLNNRIREIETVIDKYNSVSGEFKCNGYIYKDVKDWLNSYAVSNFYDTKNHAYYIEFLWNNPEEYFSISYNKFKYYYNSICIDIHNHNKAVVEMLLSYIK